VAKPSQAEDDTEASAPKSKKKLIIIIVVVIVVLLVVGGAAAWFLTKDKGAESGAEGRADAPKAESKEEPKFISLDAFTVNLQREEGAEADQYLQLNVSLKVVESDLEEKVKAVLPEIRSKINLLLSSKRASEIVTIVGKKKLALDIATEANSVLGFHNEHTSAASHVVAADAAAPADEAAPAPAAAPAGEEAVAPPPTEPGAETQTPPPVKAEKKGVVDVLFTSFLIQ
jgi:flagellar FliL protein